jgi:hypothetical protein
MPSNRALTLAEVSRRLGYRDRYNRPVMKLILSGQLKARKIGTNWRVWEKDLRHFIAALPDGGGESNG